MIENIAMRMSNQLVSKEVIDPTRRDPVAYGLSLIFSAMIITITIFVIGLATGMIVPCLLYSIVFWVARNIVGLHHCSAYYRCFSLSVGLYVIMTVSYLFTSTPLASLVWMAMSVMILIYVAREITFMDDSPKKDELRKRLGKLIRIVIMVGVAALSALAIGIKAISFPLSYGIFVISLLFVPAINPKNKEKST